MTKFPQKIFTITALVIVISLVFVIPMILENDSFNDFEKEEFVIQTETGKKIPLKLEIADTLEKRNLGLMNREILEDEIDGMLFIFERKSQSGFWMKNTYIPLSIAFIDEDGKIQEILKMEPCKIEEEKECPSYFPEEEYSFALEVEQGFFEEKEIGPGDKLLGLHEK